jgi:hypothetical protein
LEVAPHSRLDAVTAWADSQPVSAAVGEATIALVWPYNYERFDEHVAAGEDEREFGAFPNSLHAGERAPDGELHRLDGSTVRLSDGWRQRGVVLEFGSFT